MPAALYLIRHGQVANHEEDLGLTVEGSAGALEVGHRLGAEMAAAAVMLFAAPSRRTLETAALIFNGIRETAGPEGRGSLRLFPPRECRSIRNFGFRLSGRLMEPSRVYRRTLQEKGLHPSQREFYRAFWQNPDPVGFWLRCPGPYAETPQEVVDRLGRFINKTLGHGGESQVQLALCVTHSGPMRALLRALRGEDPGEVDCLESLILRNDAGAHAPVTASFRDEHFVLSLPEADARQRTGLAGRPPRDRRRSREGVEGNERWTTPRGMLSSAI